MNKTQQSKKQVPGYYRRAVGDLLVTALYDGYINLAPSLFHGLEADALQRLITAKFQEQTADGVPTAVTAYLIDNGDSVTLLNAGGSQSPVATMGEIMSSLQASGYSADDVTAVLLTHMHFDHVCGLVKPDGTAAFPNATVYVSEQESGFWLNAETARNAPEGSRAFFAIVAGSVAPYKARGAFKTFAEGEVLPGIRALATPGHTPGHTSFLIDLGGEALLLWGDIVHSHALQFRYPEISNDFDSDQAQAVTTRQELFKTAAKEGWLIAGDHLPFPGFGHLRTESQGYEWVPVEYSQNIQV